MEHLLNFKWRMKELSKEEFAKFIITYDHKVIIDLFYNLFFVAFIAMKNSRSFEDNIATMKDMITRADEIIQERNVPSAEHDGDKDNDTNYHKVIKVDELPLPLISSISGFLPFDDVLNFEKSNKRIFIGTRSPLSLQKLDVPASTDCMEYSADNRCIYNWFRFRNIKEIYLIHHRNEKDMEFKHLPICNTVNTLHFFTSRCMKFQRYIIENLQCYSNITYLDWDIEADADIIELFREQSLTLKHLKGYSGDVDGCGFIVDALDENEFKSYHGDYLSLELLYNGNKSQQLEELCIKDTDTTLFKMANDFVEVFSTLNDLKRLNMNVLADDDEYYEYFETMMTNTIDTLEFIGLQLNACQQTNRDEALSKALSILSDCMQNQHKSRLKITIDALFDDDIDEITQDHVLEGVSELLDVLVKAVDDFMIIFRLSAETSAGFYLAIQDEHETDDRFVIDYMNIDEVYDRCCISNKECTICGYNENWSMKCGDACPWVT